MAYKYDLFISYNHSFIDDWLLNHFKPFLEWYLEDALGRKPKIFIDRNGISSGDSWPLRLKEALIYSRCLIAFCSPSYFESEWCKRECYFMLHREKQEGFRTLKNPSGLVIPVNVSDGKTYPEFIKHIQYFDCRNYIIKGAGFEKTQQYVDLQIEIQRWTRDVANSIEKAPNWKNEWLQEREIDLPVGVYQPRYEAPFMG